jgi:DNA polymerase-3 subunit alpha
VFQLESRLGQSFAKKLKPRSIEHLSALVAIIRPGCLEAMRDKKSVTQHYIDRKNGQEAVEYFHPMLEPILKSTMGEMIYQEQAMQIAQEVAGFNLQEADTLRKAIGKKKVDVMAKVKDSFLAGAEKINKVTTEQAESIFGWIEKSQRYSFNASHSYSYAMNAYSSAYCKAHFPKAFFTSYLYYSKQKQKPHEEINELANNAKSMDIDVYPPSVCNMNEHFRLIDSKIFFGLSDIKGLGPSVLRRLVKTIGELDKPLNELTWIDFLVFVSQKLNSTAVKALISVGALSHMKESRSRMLYEFATYSQLSNREQAWCEKLVQKTKVKNLEQILRLLAAAPSGKDGGCANKNRLSKVSGWLQTLKTTPYKLKDSPEWISGLEESLLGIPITCSVVESCDISVANCTCKEFLKQSISHRVFLIAVTVDRINEIKTKKGKTPGQKMAFITASDISGSMDNIVCFPKEWIKFKRLLVEGNNVMLSGERSKDKESLIISRIYQI